MRIVGLDLSLTSTGVALPGETLTLEPKRRRGEERLVWLRETVLGQIRRGETDLVVIEGYSFGAQRGSAHHALGELGGVVKVALYEAGLRFVLVPPATVKRYATGRGNAKKDAMLAAAVHRSGIEFRGNDEADAWWLWALGMDAYGSPPVALPAVNRRAIESIEWPTLGVAA